MKSKIHESHDIIFDWIPYSQFYNIKEIDKGGFAMIKKYSVNNYGSNILRIYGLSQNLNTKEYIMVLEYAEGGNFNNWMNKNNRNFSWLSKLNTLFNINIGLCGEVDNIDKTKIYGVMPYVAPEVLRGKPYTQATDIYSFGIIMYFTAAGRQPFANCPHDKFLALGICNGIRPEVNELEAPKYYIVLMKKCCDQNPENRPNSFEIYESVLQFQNNEIEEQFKEVEEYRKANLLSNENNQSSTHPQADLNYAAGTIDH
ncbi:kinase-like domain-containing protein [Rhizophagus irregularis DAOM 181602=DAOM 197198]|uniref:Kinase-like domain-containing protein n=1 Tax=Rhizophagus irregularis (strain DAOM 181602 / DAOM 197198 / MUCL 43194) TaxID=747089 RepID=A0A2P4P3X8_RHIID|nr:kinase-like domain-containing protein [Rhizophagus irregularis DAOM 181602=DAOM 197198]POG60093.1 kinase-like domain-containing protein [Rhizophagus irregularis DAOM 181602=DAOM 197198]GBC49358.2 kinase-like domain-containing protein [Rhizophagus irregularis DAOM 181602=DAOM 197198]|eukprot:XP_025166959.1 kinase-like domain-containing protein [Rhizophagus irregularis DAOM 181602=DAOM 197198]